MEKNSSLPQFQTLFEQGEDGFHTFRIPSLITTPNNVLLAFAEARASPKDVDQIKIVQKSSTDHGNTWSKLKVILDAGQNSYTNPCPIAVHSAKKIILNVQFYPYPCRERDTLPGLSGPKVQQNFVIESTDDGNTWSNPRDITASTKRTTDVTTIASGPGIGIQIQEGSYKNRLILPYNQGPWKKWKNYVCYSDDEGQTWQMGDLVKGKGNETQVVELSDGSLLMNSRCYGKSGFLKLNRNRMQAFSKDGGKTFSDLLKVPEMIEPVCQASIIRISNPNSSLKTSLLFSNPHHKIMRSNGVIQMSMDDGKTWQYSRTLIPGVFGYSCLAQNAEGKILILYETGKIQIHERLELATFPISWITE